MVLTIINIIALTLLFLGWFKGNYTIVDLETWNTLAHFYNEYSDGDGNLEVPELEGGCGFFREYLEDDIDEEEEEEPDEEEDE